MIVIQFHVSRVASKFAVQWQSKIYGYKHSINLTIPHPVKNAILCKTKMAKSDRDLFATVTRRRAIYRIRYFKFN